MAKYQNIGVGIVVRDSRGWILMGKRKNSYKSGYFGIPGGRVEPHEPLLDAAKRELEEETGLCSLKLVYVGVIRDNQAVDYDFIHFCFLCDKYKGDPILNEPDKCEGWLWCNPKLIPVNILRGHKATIELVLNPKKKVIDLPLLDLSH